MNLKPLLWEASLNSSSSIRLWGNQFRLLFLIGSIGMSWCIGEEKTTQGASDAPPELVQLDTQYKQAIDRTLGPLENLKQGYIGRLEMILKSVMDDGDLEGAVALREELDRARNAEPGRNHSDPEVAKLQKTYHHHYQSIGKDAFEKAESIEAAYIEKANDLVAEFTRQERIEDALVVKNAVKESGERLEDWKARSEIRATSGKLDWAILRKSLAEKRYFSSDAVGGSTTLRSRDPEIPDPPGVLVGFEVVINPFGGSDKTVRGLSPIFRLKDGTLIVGALRGGSKGNTKKYIAKDGYAVGKLEAVSERAVRKMKITYFRISGTGLDSNDQYDTDWIGDWDGGRTSEVSSQGNLPIGVDGYFGLGLDQVALILEGTPQDKEKVPYVPTSTIDDSDSFSMQTTEVQGVPIPSDFAVAISGAPEVKLNSRQASVNALLVVEVAEENYAGAASKLNITAVPTTNTDDPSSLRFNQDVGPMMLKAMSEVIRFQRIRSGGWSRGHQIEIAFRDKYAPKDGPSAAVACSLLLNSLVTGKDLDPQFAVTGDLNADGEVQPVGGVSAKITGATKAGATRVAVPFENSRSVRDVVVLGGVEPIVSIPIFVLKTFDEAWKIAQESPDENLQAALLEFREIQDLHAKNAGGFYQSLKHPAVREKLQNIRKSEPNLLSAEILLELSSDEFSNKLSLEGSLSWIKRQTGEVLAGIRQTAQAGHTNFDGDGLADAIGSLQRMRSKIDDRCIPYNDSIIDFGKLIRELIQRPPAPGNSTRRAIDQIQQAGSRIDSNLEKLMRDAEIISELLDE